MKIALVYDMDACRRPTGVTRHALAQIERLRRRADIDLRLISGRINEPDGLAYWENLGALPRRELPVRTRDALRWWRLRPWPPVEWWTGGPVDWVYSPAEYGLPTRAARLAVTSHDILQDLRFRPPRFRDRLARIFDQADLILSVSDFNTKQLLEGLSLAAKGGWPWVPATPLTVPVLRADLHRADRAAVRADPSGWPRTPPAISALGGEFPGEEEPGSLDPLDGEAPRGGPGRAGTRAPGGRTSRRGARAA